MKSQYIPRLYKPIRLFVTVTVTNILYNRTIEKKQNKTRGQKVK